MGNRLIVATRNPAKLVELRRILEAGRVPVDVGDLDEYPDLPGVAETGLTFAENALLKARAVAAFTGLPAVADDSGICADALNGMPGILSARWAGRHGDDASNLQLLLAQLADLPDDRRGGHFVCAAALALPSGVQFVQEGRLTGALIREPRGSNGFGYDPIFVPDGDTRTTAELTASEKDAISHRGRAFRSLVPMIAEQLGR